MVFISCGEDENTDNPVYEESVSQEIISFTRNHYQAGQLKWSLKAKKAAFLENNEILVTEPFVKVYEKSESSENAESNTSSKSMAITSDKAEVNEQTQDIEFFGNVKGVSEDGTLYTDRLFWKEEEGLVYAPGKVRIVRGDSVVFGENMKANPSLETVYMDNVTFNLYPKDENIDKD